MKFFASGGSIFANKKELPFSSPTRETWIVVGGGICLGVAGILLTLPGLGTAVSIVLLVGVWATLWWQNARLANWQPKARWQVALRDVSVPFVFGVTLLLLWELAVLKFEISPVILPPPSAIATRLFAAHNMLWQDFVQTFIKGALTGYTMGVAAAFAVALVADRSDFLRRGLLPVGNFMAALPIIGTAPILVMWFGFDWHSKAAVVVVMVFFPVLVNTVEGLRASAPMQRDLMQTYGAGYGQTLWKLRVPAAMPFVFTGLKIATTLALIGAIVAEFFGSPIKGMGFRISTEVGRLALDMVWAEIVVAALAGSAFYGAIALLERVVTFWHPSQRARG
ncbi:ABC transporter permease [Actibacterium sp. 188UL27-1]|uniref:ABC transporter permease n=1 Tax=Actibacterium sp. 188UL27-1 TaxID=2786961 RepID=UPI00195CE313|nr:ABC transporter permease [Actibacterium sp. 188UL27-1]MBM7068319.1 ABC transporter permease [Actibacterium sp. 188UL27-1]